MEFTIYSIGSSTFVTEVLNGVAMIFRSGNLFQVAGIGMVLFTLWSALQKSLQPDKPMPWSQVLVGYLMFMVFFGHTVTAKVEDVYTGRVSVVDNVPIGPVAAGSILSKLGYWATRTMEQGYGSVSADERFTRSGFIDPLQTLVSMRRQDIVNTATEAIDDNIGGRSKETLLNYLRYCTLRKPNVNGSEAYEALYKGDLPESLMFTNDFYTTPVATSSGVEDKSCSEAQTDVRRIFQRMDRPSVRQKVTATLINGIQKESLLPVDKISDLDTFLANVPNLQAGLGGDLMEAQVVRPLLEAATVGYLRDGYDFTAAAALNESFQRRNAQWAAEGSSFLSTVRPMLAYIEGLFYAITPIAAIVIGMGAAGISLVGKYLAFAFWIQLWMPMLAVSNLFIVSTTIEKLSQIAASNDIYTNGSIYAFDQMSSIAETWLGIASMMVAATPLLALFLVTGSVYTLNSVAGRMSSADTFDENRVTSNMGQAPAMINQEAIHSASQLGGTVTSGAMNQMPSLQSSDMSTRARSASLSDVRQASSELGQTISRLSASGAGAQQMHSIMDSASQSETFKSNEGVQHAMSSVDQVAKSMNLTSQSSQQLQEQVTAGMQTSGSLSGGMGGAAKAGAAITAHSNDTLQTTDGHTVSMQEAMNRLKDIKFSESEEVGFAEDNARSMQEAMQNSESTFQNQQDSTQLSNSLKEVESSAEQYTDTSARTQQVGTSITTSANNAAESINSNPAASSALDSIWKKATANNPGLERDQHMRYESLSRLMESDNADTASKLMTLNSERGYAENSSYGIGQVSGDLYRGGVADAIFSGGAQSVDQSIPKDPTGSMIERAASSTDLNTARTLPGANNTSLPAQVQGGFEQGDSNITGQDPRAQYDHASGTIKHDQYSAAADRAGDQREALLAGMKGPGAFRDNNSGQGTSEGILGTSGRNLSAAWQSFSGNGDFFNTAGERIAQDTIGKTPEQYLNQLREEQHAGNMAWDLSSMFTITGNSWSQFVETDGSAMSHINEMNPDFSQQIDDLSKADQLDLKGRLSVKQLEEVQNVADTSTVDDRGTDIIKSIQNPEVRNLALSHMAEQQGFSANFMQNNDVQSYEQSASDLKAALRTAEPNASDTEINQQFAKLDSTIGHGSLHNNPAELGTANRVMQLGEEMVQDRERAEDSRNSDPAAPAGIPFSSSPGR